MTMQPLNFLRCLACSCLVLAGTFWPFSLSRAAETLVFCYEKSDARPWRTADGQGLNIVLLRLVERETQMSFQYSGLPWKRCLMQLKNNEVAGAIGSSFRADRQAMGVYPGALKAGQLPDAGKRLNMDGYVLLRRKGTAVAWNGKDIVGLEGVVGTQLGYSIIDKLLALGVKVDDGTHGARETLVKLAGGRLGAAALHTGEAEYLLRNTSSLAADLEIFSESLAEKPYFLMLSHQLLATRPELAQRVWNGIEKVRSSAEYQRLEREILARGER